MNRLTSLDMVLVPPPVPSKTREVRSPDKARPNFGIYVKALRKWFCGRTLDEAVGLYCCERDEGTGGECMQGYGASEIGSGFPLYVMSTVNDKRQVGTVAYNGNVKLDEVLT
jgi:hypothetical protein